MDVGCESSNKHLDRAARDLAAQIVEVSMLRTLDALHLAAPRRVGHDIPLLSFDIRQAAGRACDVDHGSGGLTGRNGC